MAAASKPGPRGGAGRARGASAGRCATLPRFAPKFWGVAWDKRKRRWAARYRDADGKTRTIGYFDDQEAAALAVNAAIRWAGLEGQRKTNPVDADGRVVPRA